MISTILRAAPAAAALLAFAFFLVLLPQKVKAETMNNPWGQVAPALFTHETDLSNDPFAAMDHVQLASLPASQRIKWNAPAKCVPQSLKKVVEAVAVKFGPVTVNSTARSKSKNRKAGGKSKSFHLHCRAVDFRVHGSTKGLLKWLASQKAVGGYKRYKAGFYHIDNGPDRTW